MILRQVEEIQSGQKTQMRRVVHPQEKSWTYYNDPMIRGIYRGRRFLYRVGSTYAVVPKLGAAEVARIKITKIGCERLQDITEADVKAEGISSVDEYRQIWKRHNTAKGSRWDDNPSVWVFEFELAT